MTGDVAIPSQCPSLDRGKELFLPASVVDDLLSDELLCYVYEMRNVCSIILSRSAVRVKLSHPYKMMETSSDLNSFNFVGKLMDLFFQMTLSLVIADAARLSFVFTSIVEIPSFVKVEPRYLKLSTSSSF